MRARKITVRLALPMLLYGWLLTAQGQELVTLPTRDGVTRSYLLEAPSHPPHAAAVLFPGGGGNILLRQVEDQISLSSNNFLVRSRREFVRRGIAIAVPDAPPTGNRE